jgi:hypothetical protein
MSECLPKKKQRGNLCPLIFLLLVPVSYGTAQNITLFPLGAETSAEYSRKPVERLFPAFYFTKTLEDLEAMNAGRPYWVDTKAEHEWTVQEIRNNFSILLNNDVLAFYGHPLSKNMGILGRYSIQELDSRLSALAEEYAAVNGGRGVKKAFYIIYGTVWPKGEIGILKDETLIQYIEYAQAHDILVFIDHQIGRYDPINSLKQMLPYLRYPNVHLALDPEWRTAKPMQEIGTIRAEEINQAQQVMEDYILENQIPGERMLVIHQFNWRMISSREQVNAGFKRVRLVHCADGFGSPQMKRSSYAYNAAAFSMPIKGFKLFYNFDIPGAGYDNPLLSPQEVYALNPRPDIIRYQ